MAFSTPKDFVGLEDTSLKLVSSAANRSAQTAEAQDARGDIVARDVFGEQAAPTSDYVLAADLSKAISLGACTTVGTEKVILKSLKISTKSGAAPTISASGETIQSAGTVSSTYSLGTVAASVRHKAQILGTAFTLTGDGCDLTSCDYTAECVITRATVKGDTVAHDVSQGKITVTATVVQTGTTTPVITASEGWDMTSPKSETSPDGDYETWTFTLTKSLTGTDPV